ncbi:TKL protein kinase [Phytophthora megakarya]|uniref:TKL protein kinase n=1 Tax=Phytophthora megakarya TaxID=4795 RepID=A0A225UJX5_9STRA|nr:TKL protein kinase [Phytophthora megakarya]
MSNRGVAPFEILPELSIHTNPDWFIPSREVRQDHQPYAFGSFGKVYRGWWLSTRVVVKTVSVATEKEIRSFHQEPYFWHKARHPNICRSSEAKNGKLLDYLRHVRDEGRSLVWRKLLDAARGLSIVYNDLKCIQILVSKDGVTMLTGFGLSVSMSDQNGDEEAIGAIRLKAPEVIQKGKPSAQSDVYSFGMYVADAVTSDVPWGRKMPDVAVKFHVTRKQFLPRPKALENDKQWTMPSECIKLLDAIKLIREFAEDELFQEHLRKMIEKPE